MHEKPQFLTVGTGEKARKIAYLHHKGRAPGLLWLGGFCSEMTATKAQALADFASQQNRHLIRFDYSGHGQSVMGSLPIAPPSPGQPHPDFCKATLSDWLEEAEAVFNLTPDMPQLVIGSSMGGHLAVQLALRLQQTQRLKGLVLIAPAIDFTEKLMWEKFDASLRHLILTEGQWLRPSAYSPFPTPITRSLIDDGRRNLIGEGVLPLTCPVHLLHGLKDPDVPWTFSQKLAQQLPLASVRVSFIPDGDHRLSRPQDIDLLLRTVEAMCA